MWKQPSFKCSCVDVSFGTYANTLVVPAPRWSSKEWITLDVCIAPTVLWLWWKGVMTGGSCCGHCKTVATIAVEYESIDKVLQLGFKQSRFGEHIFEVDGTL